MNWTCQQIEERITDYLEDALSVADRAAFTGHVDQCAQCKPLVQQVSGLMSAMHHVEPLEPPPGLIYRILDQTKPQRRAGWFGVPWLTPRFAMGVLSVAFVLFTVSSALNIQWSQLTWSDLKPANLYYAADRQATLMYARGVKFVNGLRVIHEIQSRLQPVGDGQTVPVKEEIKKPDDNQNKSESEKKREQNHAFEPQHLPTLLAGVMPSLTRGAIQ